MHELNSGKAGEMVAATGGVISTVVRYGVLIAQLTAAGIKLRGLSEQVRDTYRYVEGCSTSVDRLADQMAGLTVDVDTVGEHHQAAAVMRAVLADAEAMAAATEDLAVLFEHTAAAHERDYGPVAEAVRAMPVPMADAEFYSNR
jgi:methyl-accepting chemotaxis protein